MMTSTNSNSASFDNIKFKYYLYFLSLWVLFLSVSIMSFDWVFFERLMKFISLQYTPDYIVNNAYKLKIRNFVFIFCISMVLFGITSVFYLFSSLSRGWGSTRKVINVKNQTHEHLEFLTTYVMPLVFTDVNSKRTVINLLLMICFIGVIYVRTNRFYANPSLAILGFRLYKCSIKSDPSCKEYTIICRGKLSNGSQVKIKKIDDDTLIAKLI
ncbi:TPA: anti-phage protein KwaA [Yersinia enterocolitica]|nr:anti-phage protein KwaA [Yersinia enterocolitica]